MLHYYFFFYSRTPPPPHSPPPPPQVLKETMRLYPAAHMVGRKASRDTVLAGYHIPFDTPIVTPVFAAHRSEMFFPRAAEFLPERFLERAEWLKAQQAAKEDGESGIPEDTSGQRHTARPDRPPQRASAACGNHRSSQGSDVRGESVSTPAASAGGSCGVEGERSALWSKASEEMYMPFGSGPRGCIGYKFAIMEMKYCLAQLLRHFEFDVPRVSANGEANPDFDRPILELPVTAGLNLNPANGLRLRVWRREW